MRRCGPPPLTASSATARTSALALPSRLNNCCDRSTQRGNTGTTVRNRSGPSEQEPLAFSGGVLSLSICYEIVYGELVRNAAPDPAVLVTISNDTWFGRSIGPLQHMQMARMRALEMGRYLVRATNNGVSAVVDPAGRVIASAPQFEPAVVRSSVRRMNGQTPYAGFGSWPLLAGLALGLVALLITARANAAVRSG